MLFIFLLIGLTWQIQGQVFYQSTEFVAGNLTFSWNSSSEDSRCCDVLITKNTMSDEWTTTNDTNFTVGDVLLYDRIKILVRIVRSQEYYDNEMEYRVSKVKAKIGDTRDISWTTFFFPKTGYYHVYQTNREVRKIFSIDVNGVRHGRNLTKYTFLKKPYNSTSIMFEIRDITLEDAGYYNGGISSKTACSGGGVFLIVSDKPSKPIISGNLTIEVNKNITLTCSSQSTSVPDYYSKLVILYYTWFVNETKIVNETEETLLLNVTTDFKYHRYSCTATEDDMESERSETVQINPLYGPDEIRFEPNPDIQKDHLITIREGETIGPFQCIADCNPPCNMTWKYMDANGNFHCIYQGRNMSKQHVNRDIKSYHCVAEWKSQSQMERDIALDVKYLDKPELFKNNNNLEPMWTGNENMPLHVSCFVDGNPIPNIRLFKGHKEIEMNTNKSKWANYTATLCEDTDNYTCEGSSNEFNSSHQTVNINITCKLRIDKSAPLQTNFSSMSGNSAKVELIFPIIANPPPHASDITWTGPTDIPIKSTVSQREVLYKHWINTSITIYNHSNFGYYVMKYKNKTFHSITINAQDRPQQPLDFVAYSYASGYVNMTWTSGFNGGSEQFFILWMSDGSAWKIVANLTDPGKRKTVHLEHGPLTPGQEIVYRLESCNIINCSIQSVEIKVKVRDILDESLTGESEEFYAAIGVSTGVFILIVILMVVLVIIFRSKNEKKSTTENEITQEGTEMYGVVDKSKTSNNRGKDKAGTSGAMKDNYEDASHHGAETYAVVDKSILKKGGESKTTTKLVQTKKSKDKNKGMNGSLEEENVSPIGFRRTNDEGLIYIDVDFTNKPESSNTNQKPVIHGEEDRTDYTFVDFSKKAPPIQETHDEEGK